MKRLKITLAIVLLFAILLSGCGQTVPQFTGETGSALQTYAAPATLQTLSAYREAPSSFALPRAASGNVMPTTVKTTMFGAKFEGNNVSGSGEAVDGVYHFVATQTDGEAWHVKLECNYPTVAGRDYRVTYRFRSDVAGRVKFGDFQEFAIRQGENAVTGMLTATGGTSYLDLQLGMLPPFIIDFSEIEVEEYADEVEYENALPTPVKFEKESVVWEKHDQGYAPVLTRSSDGVSIEYLATSWDSGVWKSRLYIKTGLVPASGVHYHITADVTCDGDMPFEVLFNNGDEEKGYGALYGQKISAGKTTTCEAVINGTSDGDNLVLQFSLGEVPEGSTVKIDNLHVETIKDHYISVLPDLFALDSSVETGRVMRNAIPTSYKELPVNISYSGTDTVYEGHDKGYVVKLEESASSATLKITKAPASDRGVWMVKLYAATGVTLEAGTTYKISYDLESTGNQAEYEACFDGTTENAYGAPLYGRSLTAGGTDHVEYTVTPDASHGPLTLRLQLGKTDTTAGNTVTLSNLSICPIETGEMEEVALEDFAYPVSTDSHVENNSFDLEANSGAAATLTGDGSSATATVTTPGDDWHVKLYAKPRLELEAGTSYTITMDVTGAAGCTACYKRVGGEETDFGTETISNGTVTHTVTPTTGGTLEILLKIGNVAADTAVTVSNVQIKKTGGGFSPVELPDFSYPTLKGGSTVSNSFELEANNGTAAELSGNGSSATATVTTPGDDWHVKFYAKPGLELKAGTLYRISMNVSGAAGCTVCYKRVGGEETDFGTETISNGTVTHTVTPTTGGTLEILLKIGNVAANTAVTVSNIVIEESQTTTASVMPGAITYPDSFALETNNDTAAELSGSGSSATATVTTPGDDWHVKFYVKPHAILEAYKTYRISMNVTGASGYTACYKRVGGEETDFGTETISDGTVTHTVRPSTGGELEILLKIGNVPADTTVTVGGVQVDEIKTEFKNVTPSGFAYPVTTGAELQKGSFELETNNGTAASLGGNGSNATATVTTPGDDWHIKLYAKPNVELQSGTEYRITMNVTGAAGCTACYKRVGGEETDFGTETISDGTVTHIVTPTTVGTLEILLKIGNVAAGTVVKVSDIQIEKYVSEDDEDVTPEDFAYPEVVAGGVEENSFALEANSDAEAALTGDGSSATATVIKSGDDWHIKLYAKPGVELEAGKSYQVTMQVKNGNGATVSFKNTATGKEDGFGTESISSDDQTITHTIAPTEKGGMEILLKIGNLPNGTAVTLSDIMLEAAESTKGENLIPSFSYNSVGYISRAADEGYVTLLEQGSSSATLHILEAPSSGREVYKVKLNVRTGFTPEKSKGYRVSFDLESAKSQNAFEVFYDGIMESAYGATSTSLPAGKKTVSYIIMPGESKGELVLQLRCGKTKGPFGNTYTFSNLKIEEVTFRYTDTPEVKEVTTLVTQNGYKEQLEKTRDKATVRIEKTPASGREAWKSKLFVETGVTLRPEQKYRISMDVKSIIPAPFEVCFNNGDVEKGLGAIFGLISTPSGQHVEYITYAKEDTQLVIQLSLGNCSAPNTIILNNIKVEKAGTIELISDTIYTF